MNQGPHRETAKIIQFPSQRRMQQFGASSAPVRQFGAPETVRPAISYGAWYHDEAIQQESQDTKQ